MYTLDENFVAIFALAERLPAAATLIHIRETENIPLKKIAAYKVSALIQWARVSLFLTPGLGDYPSSPSLDLQLSPHPHHHQDQQSSSLLASSPVKIRNQPLEIKVGHVWESPTHPNQSINEHWQLFFKIIASWWIYSFFSKSLHLDEYIHFWARKGSTFFSQFSGLLLLLRQSFLAFQISEW